MNEQSATDRFRDLADRAAKAGLQLRLAATGDDVRIGETIEWYPVESLPRGDLEASMAFMEALLESGLPYRRQHLTRRLEDAQKVVDSLQEAYVAARKALNEARTDLSLLRTEMQAFADDYGQKEEETEEA